MIGIALWVAAVLFLAYCAIWVLGPLVLLVKLLFSSIEEKLEKRTPQKRQRNAKTGPGLSSYPPWD